MSDWDKVIERADDKTKAFLKPARVELTDSNELRIIYDERSKFHGQQIWQNIEVVAALIRSVMGAVGVCCVTVEGEKKVEIMRSR
jgi:hypothetical protein